jgi:hypothetical protein
MPNTREIDSLQKYSTFEPTLWPQQMRIFSSYTLMVRIHVVDLYHSLTNRTEPALVTGQIAKEIEKVGRLLERLYGTLNEDNLKLE